uniref:FAD_binding_2 domain-containing protein n=1 Tax=Brugia malayi TaxID=6279 RepID=A0A912GZH0_BRUMA
MVVLATDGFSCDYSKEDSVLQEFGPEKADFPTTNSPWAIGRGVKMARTMDAVLVDMHNVQIHPTAFVRKIQQQRRNFLPRKFSEERVPFAKQQRIGALDHITDKILKFCAKNEKAGAHTAFMVMDDQQFDIFDEVPNYMGIQSSKLKEVLDKITNILNYFCLRVVGYERSYRRCTWT